MNWNDPEARLALILVALFLMPFPAMAETITKPAKFEVCLQAIKDTSAQVGVQPVPVINTSDLMTVIFRTPAGSVTISCSRKAETMVITTP